MKAVNYNPKLRLQIMIILVLLSIIFNIFGGYFTRFFIAEITILSIFAISLDFIASRGGMVSLGHAMFLGIGAYSSAILSINYGIPPFYSTFFYFNWHVNSAFNRIFYSSFRRNIFYNGHISIRGNVPCLGIYF